MGRRSKLQYLQMVKMGYLRYSIGRGVPKTLQKLSQLPPC